MPVYEYQCAKCKRIVEVLQRDSDPAPICHGNMKRLISHNNFHLKGTGWYKTDYADKGKQSKWQKNGKKQSKPKKEQ